MYVCAHVYVHIQSMCNSYVCMHVDECVGAGVHVCKGQRSTSSVISQSPFILRHGLSLVSACQVSPRDPWVFTSPPRHWGSWGFKSAPYICTASSQHGEHSTNWSTSPALVSRVLFLYSNVAPLGPHIHVMRAHEPQVVKN